MGHAAETLIIHAVDIAKTPGGNTELHRTREYLALIPIESASYRLEGGEEAIFMKVLKTRGL